MKASLARLGIGNFNVKLLGAATRLDALRTGEGEGGLTGAPDESGKKRREKGLARPHRDQPVG